MSDLETIMQKIKSILYKVKEAKGVDSLIAIQKELKGLITNPNILSESLLGVFEIVEHTDIFETIAINLSYRYKYKKIGDIKVYEFVENLRIDILSYCLQNPNYPNVLEFLYTLLVEFIKANLWGLYPIVVEVRCEYLIIAIKAILGNGVLPLEILEKLPDKVIPANFEYIDYCKFYKKGEGLILSSEIGKQLLEPFSLEEIYTLLKLL